MAKTTGTVARSAIWVDGNVVDNVVRTARIARNSADPLEVIETEILAHAPSDVVIGAGSVSTHSNCADDFLTGPVQRQAAAEYVHSANDVPHHGVLGGAVFGRWTLIGNAGIDR